MADIVIDESVDTENTVRESTIRKKLQWGGAKLSCENLKRDPFSSQIFQRDLNNAMKIKNILKPQKKDKYRKLLNTGTNEQYIVDSCWYKLLNGQSDNNEINDLIKSQRLHPKNALMTERSKPNTQRNEGITKLKTKMGLVKIFTTKAKKIAKSLSPLAELNTSSTQSYLNTSKLNKDKVAKKQRRKREDRKKEKENIMQTRYTTTPNQSNKPNFYFPFASSEMKNMKGKFVVTW